MTENARILATALATADAARLPIRSWSGVNGQNVSQARKRLTSEGLRLPSDATSPAERQARSRALRKMDRAGLLAVTGETRAHVVKLTPLGDHAARKLCGLPGRLSAWLATNRLTSGEPRRDGWTSELCLCDPRPDSSYAPPAELQTIEAMLLPAIFDGWVESGSTYLGHAFFRLTADGLQALSDGEPADDDDDDGVDLDCRDLYGRTLREAGLRLATVTPDVARDIGSLPLPVSCPA